MALTISKFEELICFIRYIASSNIVIAEKSPDEVKMSSISLA